MTSTETAVVPDTSSRKCISENTHIAAATVLYTSYVCMRIFHIEHAAHAKTKKSKPFCLPTQSSKPQQVIKGLYPVPMSPCTTDAIINITHSIDKSNLVKQSLPAEVRSCDDVCL